MGVLLVHGQDLLLDSLGKQYQEHFAHGHVHGHLQEDPEPLQPQPWPGQPHLGTTRAGSEASGQTDHSQAVLGGAEQRCRVDEANPGQQEGARAEGVCLPVNAMENSNPRAQRSALIIIISDPLP